MKNKILSFILMFTVALMTTPMMGCNSATVENEINTVLNEATNVLVVADPNATWVPQLQAAIMALKVAESTWTSGGSVAYVIDALNAVEAITAVIPVTATYSPLIDVLVAGIEAVLAAFPPAVVAAAAPVKLKLAVNPHIGRVTIKHHMLHNPATEFKAAWNSAVKANPALAGAELN